MEEEVEEEEEKKEEKIPLCESIDSFRTAALLPPQLQAQPAQARHGYHCPSDAFGTIFRGDKANSITGCVHYLVGWSAGW